MTYSLDVLSVEQGSTQQLGRLCRSVRGYEQYLALTSSATAAHILTSLKFQTRKSRCNCKRPAKYT